MPRTIRPKQNNIKKGIKADKKVQRHIDAIERLQNWQSLSPKQQLDSLDERGEVAFRQRERIFERFGVESKKFDRNTKQFI